MLAVRSSSAIFRIIFFQFGLFFYELHKKTMGLLLCGTHYVTNTKNIRDVKVLQCVGMQPLLTSSELFIISCCCKIHDDISND